MNLRHTKNGAIFIGPPRISVIVVKIGQTRMHFGTGNHVTF